MSRKLSPGPGARGLTHPDQRPPGSSQEALFEGCRIIKLPEPKQAEPTCAGCGFMSPETFICSAMDALTRPKRPACETYEPRGRAA